MKKLLTIAISIFMVLAIVGCGDSKPKSESDAKSEPKSETQSQTDIIVKDIETSQDLIGVWCVTQPLPDYFTADYREIKGLEDFKTSAVYEWYIELHEDGTQSYVIDYELNKQSREKSHYILYDELFCEAKKVLPENEFVSLVKDSYGYKNYQKLLDSNTINEYTDSENYEGYKEFLKTANAEMKKYADEPIEKQAAIGAMWYQLLEDIGTRFEYKDGKWQALASVVYNWSYEDGKYVYSGMSHTLEGDTKSLFVDGEYFKGSNWTRVK